jgi:hypothetical protein
MQRKFFVSLAAVIAIAGLVPSANADMVYSFSFGSNATGTFTTGAASPGDPGFDLVTALQVNKFVDAELGQVPVSIDATSSGQFVPGAAYDPTTGAFLNHFGGGTFTNVGDIGNSGQGESPAGTINGQPAYVLGPSFSLGSTALSIQSSSPNGSLYTANGALVVTLQAVPEPSTVVLFGLGIVGSITWLKHRRGRFSTARSPG